MAKHSSVRIAKDRLRTLVGSDRMKCQPEICERISRELYQVLSKYVEITPRGICCLFWQDRYTYQIYRRRIVKFLKITKPYRLKDYKFTLVILVLAISALGVLVIGSANEAYQGRQLIGLAGAVALMIIVSLIDYVWIANFYWILYFLSVGMLVLVLIPGIGEVVNGARR